MRRHRKRFPEIRQVMQLLFFTRSRLFLLFPLWPLPALAAAANYESQFQRLHVIFSFCVALSDTFTLFIPLSRITKQDKLKHQFHSDAADVASSRVAFFHGVHVYVNGYTQPDSLTIKNMLAAHGGVWEQYNGRFVPHK